MASITSSSAALAATTALAAGAYLNAKFSIATDLRELWNDRDWFKRLQGLIRELGDDCTLYHLLEIATTANAEREALWFEGLVWTYRQLKDEVDRLATVLHHEGVRGGDYIAVFMTNSPEMVMAILAISRLGGVSALINSALRGDTFVYCMEVSTASMVISTPDLAEHVVFPLPHITLSLFSFSSTSSREEVKDGQYPVTVIRQVDLPEESLEMPKPKRTAADVAMLIYTSGTTGKPKACVIRNARICLVSIPLSLDLYNPKKYYPLRTYSALPLFHATALFTGLCYCIGNIGTFCLARKFSSSNFWKDVTESRATRILYIGELGRYLVSSPPSPYDRGHSCIVANGNGLRSEVWEKFRTRFQVPEIREFYRSTEGIAKLDNFGSSAAGAGQIGFAGAIRRRLEDATLIVAINLDTGVPYRDPKTGFCIRSKPGEPGEVIGRVRDRVALAEYLHNEAATEEKLLRDVFAKGDCFQRTGDLVVQQPSGWITFSDRIGDSFRWKGENVSAGEVRDHICKLDNVQDALVYGVKLQSYDGQAGAVAITLDPHTPHTETTFIRGLHKAPRKVGMPAYAMPRLIRITTALPIGVTFKQSKVSISKKSWAPKIDEDGDNLYWLNGTNYHSLDHGCWRNIEKGIAKL